MKLVHVDSSAPQAIPRRALAAAATPDLLFRDLAAHHRKGLSAFVLRNIGDPTDADDLTRQAFVDAAHSLQTVQGEAALSTWLYGIAVNLVRKSPVAFATPDRGAGWGTHSSRRS